MINWPMMFRDPMSQFSPFGANPMALQAFGSGYAQGVQAGQASIVAGGCYGPQGQGQMPGFPGAELAMNLALQRFFAQCADPGMQPYAPQPGLELGVKGAMQQYNQMGALGAAQGCAPGTEAMMQELQLVVCLMAFALMMHQMQQMSAGQMGGCRPVPGGVPGQWGSQQRVPGGWDNKPGWGQDVPPWTPPGGPMPGGSAMGQRLAASAENVARRRGTVGWCFAGAKESIRAATGVQLHGGSAYMAADQLAGNGRFREVSVSPQQLRDLPAGAVVVWGRTNVSPHGHISVALGDGREASDHVQRQMTSLRGHTNFRVFIPA